MAKFILALILFVCASTRYANADYLFTFENKSFTQGSGLGTIDVYVSSASNLAPTGLTTVFTLPSGANWSGPVSLGGAGMYGAGAAGLSIVNFTSGQQAAADISFNNPLAVSSSPVLFGTLNVDIGTLGVGTHSISYSSIDSWVPGPGGVGGSAVSGAAGAGNFTVSAVPEPSSMALLGLMAAGGVAYRKLRKAKKEPAVS